MRQALKYFSLLVSIIVISCNTNTMSGVYVCDQSQKKRDSTINRGNNVEVFMDLTCTIQEIDFKGNSTVELKLKNGPFATSYVRDKKYIRIKSTGADILLRVEDNKTLSGEGIFQGLYHKK